MGKIFDFVCKKTLNFLMLPQITIENTYFIRSIDNMFKLI